jgi:deoxyribodipyrimidine photo-lyase
MRINDNTALIELSKEYADTPILPIFIFNPQQIEPEKNVYFNNVCVEFMIECLNSLNNQLKGYLQYFHGDDIEIIKKLLKHVEVQAVGYNEDFTPFAKKRDAKLNEFLKNANIRTITSRTDYTLFDFNILNESNKPYEVYTPFYRKCIHNLIKIPKVKTFQNNDINIYKEQLPGNIKNISKYIQEYTPQKHLEGGRDNALSILHRIKNGEFKDYEAYRDFPAMDRTTKLSAYLKFGCISVREAFEVCVKAYGTSHGLVRELIWREFYANITHFFPHILQGQQTVDSQNLPLKPKYSSLSWSSGKEDLFKAWCQGKTGYPFVDAAMICMNKTGFMHNRLRMVVASFLTKDLLIDWRLGEKYFAQKLIDYDPSSNSGGWQWASSVGADAQPYFRIFNPWLQSEKFDKDCIFIKKWIPALVDVPSKHIHSWYKYHTEYNNIKKGIGYPIPIIDHFKMIKKAKDFYAPHN